MADPNTSFREHDIEFLQKRAKLWFEAVLGEQFGDRSLADLIADGNIMYRVSKLITREMTGASPGPQEISPSTFSDISAFGKKSGKYLPYANVDTFLKTCRKVGLTDVELFTPPDAVEGKDIRRVCTSIRSLARKARAQHIRVPDFEDVNRPLPMPKEKVGELKGSLQHSNTSPISHASVTPEADIQQSERVQIISRFLSATRSPERLIGEGNLLTEGLSPGTPLLSTQSFSSNDTSSWRSPSTPTPTIGGATSPVLTKSSSANEPSSFRFSTPVGNQGSTPESKAGDEEFDDDKHPARLSTSSSADQSSQSPFSQKKLGSFRHAQPHFVKTSSHISDKVDHPKPSSDKDGGPEDASAPHELAPKVKPSPPAPSSDDTKKAFSSSKQPYRHPQPHFSFSKSSRSDAAGAPVSHSQDLQAGAPTSHSQDLQAKISDADSGADARKASPPAKPKPPSSNKIIEKDPRSSPLTPEMKPRASSKHAPKRAQEQPVNRRGSKDKPTAKEYSFQINLKFWMPIVAGALAFMGTLLLARKRDSKLYEVKSGDTLSKISKEVGNKNWDELVKLNPSITNPNLIFPSERLKIPMERGRHRST